MSGAPSFFAVIGIAFLAGVFFTLGALVVCKTFGWAPVNITIHNYPSTDRASDEEISRHLQMRMEGKRA